MKTYKATYWRSNPQLRTGGTTTKRTIEAKTLKSAEKKASQLSAAYGITLLKVEEA